MLTHRDLRGRTCVVTGANTGVGRATAVALAARGADVVLACRDRARARAVLDEIDAVRGSASFLSLDLADLSSVRGAAAALAGRSIDVLVNNAGVGGVRGTTRDGFEMAFGTNYLGHYAFTRALLPRLAADARIVHLGSGSYARVSSLDLRSVVGRTRTLTGIDEYGVSKLAVMLFHHELVRRFASERRITSLVADPGNVASDAYRHLPWPVRALWTCAMKSPVEGARTTLFCATSPDARSGVYVDARPFEPSALARDSRLALELWQRSADWVGLDAEGAGA